MYELRRYAMAGGGVPLADWPARLRDPRARARIEIRLRRLATGLVGDARTVGEGVIELRVDIGPGYRVYAGRHGVQLIILLCGGDKRTQHEDIVLARQYWNDWKRRSS